MTVTTRAGTSRQDDRTDVVDSVIGSRVHVIEPGRVPWVGTVVATARGLRCWYLEVVRDDGRVRSVPVYSVF